jgi:hypothetical protein
MGLRSIVTAIVFGAVAIMASISSAEAYWPSKYCRHHYCVRPYHHMHMHCRVRHHHRYCWRG